MVYTYISKTPQYKYLSNGVDAWILLLPNNVGLNKNDVVEVVEVDSSDVPTGRVSTGVIRFIESNGILTSVPDTSYFYIINVINLPMDLIYKANLTQSGTGDPSVIELVNTTGKTFTWTREDTGTYGCNIDGGVDGSRTFALIGGDQHFIDLVAISCVAGDFDININSGNAFGTPQDDILNSTSVFIQFFP